MFPFWFAMNIRVTLRVCHIFRHASFGWIWSEMIEIWHSDTPLLPLISSSPFQFNEQLWHLWISFDPGSSKHYFIIIYYIHGITIPICSMVLVYLPTWLGDFGQGQMLVNIPARWSIWDCYSYRWYWYHCQDCSHPSQANYSLVGGAKLTTWFVVLEANSTHICANQA